MYMSDHGESFWDDERKLSLHGSYQISKNEYHVPFLIWYSDEYANLNADKVNAMSQNKTTPVSSDVVFYSLLDAAGIDDIIDSTRSICSSCLVRQDSIWVVTGSGAVEPMPVP
jgi:glucan phosphoethanolaminetransferase (alkaline phosphatase superfamily)